MEVKNSMPTETGETTNNSLEMGAGSAAVTYKFKVKYYNEAECPAKIGDVFYKTINEACAVGGEVTLVNDATESVIIPAGKSVILNLNGHTLTSSDSNTITNNGELVINGTGKIDCITDKMVGVQNNGKCKINTGVEITRSNDTEDATTATTGYVVRNYNTMTIEDGVNIHTVNQVTSLVTNGWYDTTNAGPDDKAVMTINGGTFTGGKINVKNDELGEMTINGGTFSGSKNRNMIQNWHSLTVEGGIFHGSIRTGIYGKGIGHTVIKNGDFTDGLLEPMKDYESNDITVYGGTFAKTFTDLTTYLADGYQAVEDGETLVVTKMTVYQQVDNVIDGLDEKGMNITADPDNARQYNVVVGAANFDSVIDEVVAVDGIQKLSVGIEGSDTVYEYIPGTTDLADFKANVNSLLPDSNTDPEVTLVMTVE